MFVEAYNLLAASGFVVVAVGCYGAYHSVVPGGGGEYFVDTTTTCTKSTGGGEPWKVPHPLFSNRYVTRPNFPTNEVMYVVGDLCEKLKSPFQTAL